jgi:hypothetical protein
MRLLAAVALALVIGACVRAAPGAAADPARAGATLVVDNQSTLEMTVYATRGAERVRLGQARSLQSTTLRIPSDLVGGFALRFIADPIGSNRTPISEEITVWPGDTVEIRIPPS